MALRKAFCSKQIVDTGCFEVKQTGVHHLEVLVKCIFLHETTSTQHKRQSSKPNVRMMANRFRFYSIFDDITNYLMMSSIMQ